MKHYVENQYLDDTSLDSAPKSPIYKNCQNLHKIYSNSLKKNSLFNYNRLFFSKIEQKHICESKNDDNSCNIYDASVIT